MNKAQLVAALADRIGDRAVAAAAVDELLDVIVRSVQAGDSVSITGFGVFERRERAARVARNPRTGLTVKVAATRVPAFRAGTGFRDVVSGARALPARGSGSSAAAPRATVTRTRAPARPATRPARSTAAKAPVLPAATTPPPEVATKPSGKGKKSGKGSDKKSGKAKGGKKKK